jgi:hypothetical protein
MPEGRREGELADEFPHVTLDIRSESTQHTGTGIELFE